MPGVARSAPEARSDGLDPMGKPFFCLASRGLASVSSNRAPLRTALFMFAKEQSLLARLLD